MPLEGNLELSKRWFVFVCRSKPLSGSHLFQKFWAICRTSHLFSSPSQRMNPPTRCRPGRWSGGYSRDSAYTFRAPRTGYSSAVTLPSPRRLKSCHISRSWRISHCYASPFLKARPGSTHGYDIIDHAQLNPELGTPEDFDLFVKALHQHEMGQILDIVPNHMGVLGGDNAWWRWTCSKTENPRNLQTSSRH